MRRARLHSFRSALAAVAERWAGANSRPDVAGKTGRFKLKRKKLFDKTHFQTVLEQMHDVDKDLTKESTNLYNRLSRKMQSYVRKCEPLSDEDILGIKDLLRHEKRHVRVIAACDLLCRGYVTAWPTMIAAATPCYMPADDGPDEEWRDYNATATARLFLMMNYNRLQHLPLSPTLDEAEAGWRAAGWDGFTLMRLTLPELPSARIARY